MNNIIRFAALILTVSFLIGFTSAKSRGQDYKPFIEEDKYWDVALHFPDDVMCHDYYYRYFFYGDTIINGLAYSPLVSSGRICEGRMFNRDTFPVNGIFYREDTISQSVFRYDASLQEEKQLFQFYMEVGDTIFYDRCSAIEQAVVQNIDMIVDRYGISRRAFNYRDINADFDVQGFDNYSLIEGIGTGSPFEGVCHGANVQRLMCTFYNEPPEEDWNCTRFITSSSEILDSKIAVYPNPVIDRLIIGGVDRDAIVKVYNSYGQLVESFIIYRDYEMDVINYPPGIYMVQISDHKGRLLAINKVLKY